MALPGETEAGSAGKQPCRGIVRRAHRDDDHGCGNELLAPTFNPIGSKDPDALKIPARRAASTLTRSARSPVPAEPAQGLEASLYQILQVLSVTLFEKTPILGALQPFDSHDNLLDDPNQLILFDF